MRRPTVHVVGAGVSGLCAALGLAGSVEAEVVVHDSAAQAGGRRRSFFDEATGLTIDGGDALILSNARSALAAIAAIGAGGQWRDAAPDGVAFVDMASGERWRLNPNRGPIPWWTLSASRRAPGLGAGAYWLAARLKRARAGKRLADYAPEGAAADRLWRPLALGVLNTDLERASARLAGAALGGALLGGARPLAPAHGFARAFVEPALKTLRRHGVAIRFARRLTALALAGERIAALEFEHDRIDLAAGDAVVLAVPPRVAQALTPALSAPTEFAAAICVHFAARPPPEAPRLIAAVHGALHWLACGDDRVVAAMRDAEAALAAPRETLAATLWRDAAALTGLSDDPPPWRVVAQRRATFAATPEQDALRPTSETHWPNLFLAGAWVQTGLPDGIESAARSGAAAAERARRWLAG